MDFDQSIIELASNPISADAPCGINAKYETAYEQLEAELAKSESITSESTDWDTVYNLATQILKDISKDFPTACYFTYALYERDSFKGLANGFALIEKLSETYWEEMFPPVKRLRGRQNAAQWLVEKVAPIMEAAEPKPEEMNTISALASAVKNLDFLLAEKMGDNAPNFMEINRPLKRLKQVAAAAEAEQAAKVETKPVETKPEPEQQPVQSNSTPSAPDSVAPSPTESQPATVTPQPTPKTAPAPSTAPISSEPVGDVGSDADARKAYRQIQDGLRKLADFYGQAKASDPRRFRFSRSALWDSLDKLPPNQDGKTQLPAPPADKLKKLKSLFEAGDFLEVLNTGEKSASKMPYWFDGNRYIVMAMGELGAEFSKAKVALTSELVEFVNRLPKIVEFSYTNGEPFADELTRQWLLSLNESSQSSQSTTSGGVDDIQSALSEAKKLALGGKLTEGFEVIKACKVESKRDRFKIKLACAELACLNGQEKVGIPMLERMIEEIRSLSVADWESDFIAKALALLVNAYDKLNEEEAGKKQQKMADAYDQLCWYDPSLAAN